MENYLILLIILGITSLIYLFLYIVGKIYADNDGISPEPVLWGKIINSVILLLTISAFVVDVIVEPATILGDYIISVLFFWLPLFLVAYILDDYSNKYCEVIIGMTDYASKKIADEIKNCK